jgi:hypothetical protein
LLSDKSQFGEGRTRVVFVPLEKTWRRSVVLGEWEAGTPGGGFCETIVVVVRTESIVVVMLVDEFR